MQDLLYKCVDNMLAYNQKGIKDYLHEAKDHKIIHEKNDENGHQILFMKYDNHILEKIANELLE